MAATTAYDQETEMVTPGSQVHDSTRHSRLEFAIEKRLMKVGCSCVPDLQNELSFEAAAAEILSAIETLREKSIVRQVEDPQAKYPEQFVYELV